MWVKRGHGTEGDLRFLLEGTGREARWWWSLSVCQTHVSEGPPHVRGVGEGSGSFCGEPCARWQAAPPGPQEGRPRPTPGAGLRPRLSGCWPPLTRAAPHASPHPVLPSITGLVKVLTPAATRKADSRTPSGLCQAVLSGLPSLCSVFGLRPTRAPAAPAAWRARTV